MTHSDSSPSSIRDDSICEPSLNPNKSSGDIVELKPCRKCGVLDFELWDGRGTQAYLICNECGQEEGVQVVDLFDQDERPAWDDKLLCYPPHAVKRANEHLVEEWNTRAPDPESAAEVERLRREVERVASTLTRYAAERDHYRSEKFRLESAVLTAESAVAAAWEEAAKIVCETLNGIEVNRFIVSGKAMIDQHGNDLFIAKVDVERILAERASAIRAAGSKKTAESGHSPSTHNSESE